MGADVGWFATPKVELRLPAFGGDGSNAPGGAMPGDAGGLLKGSDEFVETTESSNRCAS